MNGEEQAIAAALAAYEAAVNAANLDGVAALFVADGVLMGQGTPPAVGAVAVRQAYRAIFDAVALDIRFDVAEVVQTGPDWAFLRSTSRGSITVRANGERAPEHNQELFVFRKAEGAWKIARYCFNVVDAA